MHASVLALNDAALVGESHDTRPREADITGAEYWSGACAVATAWLIFILYAASRGLG
jgi:hypothetical protein